MKKRIKNIINNAGLSIIEVVISITIIIVGISSVMILFENNFRAQELNMRKLVAYNLAKEGIEIARWQRDTYWFTEQNKYKVDWGASGEAAVVPVLDNDSNPLKGWILKTKGGNGNEGKPEVYLYYDGSSNKIMYVQSDKSAADIPSSWVKTDYKRILYINRNNPDGNVQTNNDMQVKSRVEYAPGKSVELEAFLYNWY